MSNLSTILSSMSSAFNNTTTNNDKKSVSLTEDSTLKWRGLLNNTYASKESKHSRKLSSETNPNTSASNNNSSGSSGNSSNIEAECKVDVTKETKAEQKQENNVDTTENVVVIDKNLEKSGKNDENPESIATTTTTIANTDEMNVFVTNSDKTNNDKISGGVTSYGNNKKSSKGTKSARNLSIDLKSDRSLRSKGSVNESIIDESPTKSEVLKDEEKNETPKRGRGRKKKIILNESEKISKNNETVEENKIEKNVPEEKVNENEQEKQIKTEDTNNEGEKPRIVVTIRQNRSSNNSTVVIPNKSEQTFIKKRGRRGKQPNLASNNQQKTPQSSTHILTRSARKEDSTSPNDKNTRPLRRIRPTAKILASDELREGFVQQNCARLNITNEEIQNMEHEQRGHMELINNNETNNKRQTRDTKRRSGKDDSGKIDVNVQKSQQPVSSQSLTTNTNNNNKKSSSPLDERETSEVKRSLSFSDTSSSSKISYSSFTAVPSLPPKIKCPDPNEFLREIRNAKLALPKSPEDNKKLNKKQHKRLMKMKEKHFFLLGLRRARRGGVKDSDTDDMSDECDEFVPARKVMVQRGKPGVTLRLRNFRKEMGMDEKSATKRTLENNDQNNSSKRSRKDFDLSANNMKKQQQQQAKTTLVPVSMSTPYHNNSVGTSPSSSSTPNVTSVSRQMLVLPATNSGAVSEVIDVDDLNLICLCIQPSKYFLQRTAAISHCCAIDEVEGQKIGCTNEVHGDLLQLLRPSVRTSYMVLCDSHKKRLISHNCCAGCGVFLTQGIFSLCPNRHFFHRDCTMKYILNAPYDPNSTDFTGPTLAFKCPHCGVDVPDSSFRVTMKCENVPIFFTNQKHQIHRAKMTITNKPSISPNSFLLNIERLIPESVLDVLQMANNKLKVEPPKIFTARDFCDAIYNNAGIEIVAEIIASGFDLMKRFKEFQNGTCLHLVSNFGNITILYMILCRITSADFINIIDKERRTALMCAVMGRKNEIVKVLLQFGADVQCKGPQGMTVLHLAAKTGNLPAVQIILDYYRQNAGDNKVKTLLNMTDDGKWTALVWAAENGYAEIVSYFISLGADVNICDSHNNTVLHWATLSGKIDTIYPLMLPNTLYNTQNINGDTALHIACRRGNTRICLVLVANGANLYTRNDAGEIPLDCVPNENSQCARVLQFNMEMRSLGNYKERKVLCHDISNGREKYPVQMVQRLGNDETMIMSDFKYITKNIILQNAVQIDMRISQMRVCSCSDSCVGENCQCGQISIQNWYNTDGQLISDFNYDDPAMIFECNDVCGCNMSLCKNRVVQHGTKLPLQVFECDDPVKGFGVRTLIKVAKGTFITEYIGEILTDAEADRRTDDSFFFDLGASEHCIDAKFYGNTSRFFNHSCEANVVPIRVYYEHQDIRFPKIAFFASRDIEPEEEITFDYGTKFWLAKYKQFTCHCKSTKCRYSASKILGTLEEYNQRNNSN